MPVQRLSLTRFGVVILLLTGSLYAIMSMGSVQAAPSAQFATPTPLADDLAELGASTACQDMFSKFYGWLDQGKRVRFYLVSNEFSIHDDDPTGDNVASYATGELTYSEADKTQLTGRGLQYFNDRNMFDPRSADKIQLNISPTSLQVILLSWGNTLVSFSRPHCTNGALITMAPGNPSRSGDYKVMFIFTFRAA